MEKNGTLTLEQLTNKIEGYQEKIDALRLDGTLKFHRLKDENDKIRHNKNISKEDKQKLISRNDEEIVKAQRVIRQNKGDINDLVGEAKDVLKDNYPLLYKEKIAQLKALKLEKGEEYKKNVAAIKEEHQKTLEEIDKKYYVKQLSGDEKSHFDNELSAIKSAHDEKLKAIENEHKNDRLDENFVSANRNNIELLENEKKTVLADLTATHKEEVKGLSGDELKAKNRDFRHSYFAKENEYDAKIDSLKKEFNDAKSELENRTKVKIDAENADYESKYRSLHEKYGIKILTEADLENKKIDIANAKLAYKSHLYDAKQTYDKQKAAIKDEKHEAYTYKVNNLKKLTDNKVDLGTTIGAKWENYCFNFKLKDFLLRNALYFIVIIFFIYTIIGTNGNIVSTIHIVNMLTQTSTKLFYALGVAGLILLAGTDLSIGRMTALGACITCIFLGRSVYDGVLFGGTVDLSTTPAAARIIIALVVSILVCTIFSTIAGFFSAKFKMHPFITTLSTQLVIFGLMQVFFTKYPAFNIVPEYKDMIIGDGQYLLILYAVIAIIAMWFIWNRTKFGKNMFAVGGNAEAASVSGISVFWTTLFVFIMAGILYGIGGFLEGARSGVANSNLGSGTELDAIAACVIGGISFSGGVGKIRGAVVGALIFTCLTYCLTQLGYNTNMQYIFKGIIIMAAVCLDSIKYLKKK